MYQPPTLSQNTTPDAADSALIPLEVLFADPQRTCPQISPDGTRLAWIAPHHGVPNLWVAGVGQQDARPVTAEEGRGIAHFAWWPDGRLGYLKDHNGDEQWRLYDVDPASGQVRDLTPFPGVSAQLIKVSTPITDRVLIGLNRRDPRLHDVYALSLASGELTKVVDNPGLVGIVADHALQRFAGCAPLPDGGMSVMLSDPGQMLGWRPLLTVDQPDALTTTPLGFDAETSRLLASTPHGADATRLVWIDLGTGALEVISQDEIYDVAAVYAERRSNRPLLVAYQRERLHWAALTPEAQRDLDVLRDVDDGDLMILSSDYAEHTWTLAYSHADGPTRFYTYHRPTATAAFLFTDRPELENLALAPMQPLLVTARGGLELHGYLTFPVGRARQGLPTVLLVHGGPWMRDMWGLDPTVQWLADRGYLVAQINYRGSSGYGKAFLNAGNREWGAAMHEDLIDTVGHLITAGYADPARVAIYGRSYGGYAALVGAAFTPEVFACAVDLCGPCNLNTAIGSIPATWKPMLAQFHTRVGNPDTEPEFLWSRSPLSRVDDIKIPLLIVQGANDPRVTPEESRQLVDALSARGLAHEYLLFPDEGHHLERPENRMRFHATAEAFLATHLAGANGQASAGPELAGEAIPTR